MTDVVQKLWGFCHTLRHDGIDYGDYIEQITFLLFLKMAHEKGVEVPAGCAWQTLRDLSGSKLTEGYQDMLRKLSKQPGILGDIYAEAQSRFTNPVNLKRLVNLTRLYLFDPKYKLRSEQSSGPLDADDAPLPLGMPKKVDIDKMHSYRDAIRDRELRHAVKYAAILYPGSEVLYTDGVEALHADPHSVDVLQQRLQAVLAQAMHL